MIVMRKGKILVFLLLAGYLLGIHDGKIALWKNEDPELIRVFPYRAELLPPADQHALQNGIPIEDAHHLSRLLQDYLS
jgi:hypothetical protein